MLSQFKPKSAHRLSSTNVKTPSESNDNKQRYSFVVLQNHVGQHRYAIDQELIPPANPRLDGRYMVSTFGQTNALNQARDTVNVSSDVA